MSPYLTIAAQIVFRSRQSIISIVHNLPTARRQDLFQSSYLILTCHQPALNERVLRPVQNNNDLTFRHRNNDNTSLAHTGRIRNSGSEPLLLFLHCEVPPYKKKIHGHIPSTSFPSTCRLHTSQECPGIWIRGSEDTVGQSGKEARPRREEKRRAQCVPPRFPIVSGNRVMTLLALLPSCLLVVGCQGEVAIAIAIFQLFGIGFPDHD